MLVVVGACALIKPFTLDKTILKRDFPVNIIACALMFALAFIGSALGVIDGIVMLVLMIAYITWLVIAAMKNREESSEEIKTFREESSEEIKTLSPVVSVIFIIGGIAAIIFGGNLVVENAKAIASAMGLSETFIGLTIVAVGTSLPELVTSIVASKKGENGLALGNVVGSNIFNLLFILGISSSITPIAVDSVAIFNIVLLLIMTVVMYILCVCTKKLGRISGAVMVLAYVAYTVYLIIQG